MSEDKALKIQLILELLGEGKLEEAKQKFDELKQTTGDLGQEFKGLNISSDDAGQTVGKTGDKTEEAGEQAHAAGEKHRALRHIMGQLSQIIPGLGEGFEILSQAYIRAGESAEAGAVGVTEFNVALQEVLVTLGPLVIAMLSIEAAIQMWDRYKEKVEAAAEAQAEATKKIVEATHKAFEAVQQLEEAMHPKVHDAAERDEAELKKRQQQTDNEFDRQRQFNKVTEDRELAAAGSSEEKEKIKQRFEILDQELQIWRDKQKVANEEAIMGTMQKQLIELKTAEDSLTEQSAEAYQRGQKTNDMSDYNAIADALDKNAKEAKAIRDKLDDLAEQNDLESTNVKFVNDTNRQVATARGRKYNEPGNDIPYANEKRDDAENKFATGKSIADTAMRGGKVDPEQQQYLILLEQAITGQKQTFQSAVNLIERQAQNAEFQHRLLNNVWGKVEQVAGELQRLDARVRNMHFNFK